MSGVARVEPFSIAAPSITTTIDRSRSITLFINPFINPFTSPSIAMSIHRLIHCSAYCSIHHPVQRPVRITSNINNSQLFKSSSTVAVSGKTEEGLALGLF